MNDTKEFNLEVIGRDLEAKLGYSNELSFGIRNLLITLTTFLIAFSSPIFTNITGLDNSQRLLLYLSWIFGVISLFAGLVGFFVDIKFFIEGARLNKKIYNMISSSDDTNEAVNQCKEKTSRITDTSNIVSSTTTPIIIQIIFWILQLVFLMTFLTGVLF